MDSVSILLQEARPLYLRHKAGRKMRFKCGCAVVISVLVLMPVMVGVQFGRAGVDSLYAQLYSNSPFDNQDVFYIDEFDAMGII